MKSFLHPINLVIQHEIQNVKDALDVVPVRLVEASARLENYEILPIQI